MKKNLLIATGLVFMAAMVGLAHAKPDQAQFLQSPIALEGQHYRGILDGRPVGFEVRSGMALMEGCIALGQANEVLTRMRSQMPDGKHLTGAHDEMIALNDAKGFILGNGLSLWGKNTAGVVEVPYTIDTDPDNKVPPAITAINTQLAGLFQFIPRAGQSDYVSFNLTEDANFGSCFSQVGRSGGRQNIGGSRSCGTDTLVHEMGHALGMWHEQQRADQKWWTQADLSNVDPHTVYNYTPRPESLEIAGYDLGSIMHYGSFGFVKNFYPVLSSIPAGVPIGSRALFSEADIESLRRLYGLVDTQITIDSFPSGLSVTVDGVSITTPQKFTWALGSTHTVTAPEGVFTFQQEQRTFARWSTDAAGTRNRTQSITVVPGDGRFGYPTDKPAVSTYTAFFASVVEVRSSSNVAGGQVSLSPEPEAIPGATGRYWRENTRNHVTATAPAGYQFVRFGPSTGLFHYPSAANRNTNPHQGVVAVGADIPVADWIANFSDQADMFIRAQDGNGNMGGTYFIDRIDVTPAVDTNIPEVTWTWNPGESRTFRALTEVPGQTQNSRNRFINWTGITPLAAANEIRVTKPTGPIGASQTVVANYLKQYRPNVELENSTSGICGNLTVTPTATDGFYDFGTALQASYNPPPGFQIVQWLGNFTPVGSNTATTAQMTVNDIPDARPEINTVATPLRIFTVNPNSLARDREAQFDIRGSGFTAGSEVYVANVRRTASFIESTRMRVTLPVGTAPDVGRAVVSVVNRFGSCSVASFASADFKATETTSSISIMPKNGWWWNPHESGRGFFIERQNSTIFLAGYYYENDGRAAWFTAAGTLSGNVFRADATTFRNGQTLTSAYTPPVGPGILGTVQITFHSSTNATLQWPGGSDTPLVPFEFGGAGSIAAESGWWWNASESGRGYSIEVQGNTLFFIGFMYDGNGNPVWYLSAGTMQSATRFVGSLDVFRDGQLLNGDYRPPSLPPTSVGQMTIDFSGASTGTITWPNNAQTAITRFRF